MAKHISSITKDGMPYQQHEVAIDNGKTSIGVVDVPAPTTFEQLANFVEAGVESEGQACHLYTVAKAIELQRQARIAKKGGRMPQADFDRIFNAMESKFKVKWSVAVAEVNRIYAAEQV